MKYTPKSKEEKQAEIKALIDDAQNKIDSYFKSPENIKEYLEFMSKFYNYSLNNCCLIENQFSGARAVAPYKTWQEKGFTVKKGEKAIRILVPCKPTKRFENEAGEIKPITKATAEERVKIKNGTYKISEGKMYFMKGTVFDISQTNAKAEDLPKIFPNKWLEGDVKDYKLLRKALENVADKIGVKIVAPKYELGAAKGVSYTNTREVALNPRNSELQNVKTLVHELTHAKLHTMENSSKYEAHEMEFQAELTAYTVCKYVGLDTSEYSINYLHSWTKDKTFEDKKQLLKEVHETSKEFITVIEDTLVDEREKVQDKDNKISYYVCECMEFENMAERYDDVPTIEEAINIYNNLPDDSNMGGGIGIAIDDEQYSLYQNANVDTLEFYPKEITEIKDVQYAIDKLKNEFESTDSKEKEVVIPYLRNLEKAPYFENNIYGQDIEPKGEYMSQDTYFYKNQSAKLEGWEYGYVKFTNPLLLEHKNTGVDGWKKDLSEKYNGLTGKQLSNAIMKDGYDAIITTEGIEFSEIVNLKGTKISELEFYELTPKGHEMEKGYVDPEISLQGQKEISASEDLIKNKTSDASKIYKERESDKKSNENILTNNKEILEMLEQLNKIDGNTTINDIFNIFDQMENRIDKVKTELKAVKEQISEMQDLKNDKTTKKTLGDMVQLLDVEVDKSKEKLNTIKENIKEKCKGVVNDLRKNGHITLKKVTDKLELHHNLSSIKASMMEFGEKLENTMNKIDTVTMHIGEIKNHAKVIGSTITGKEFVAGIESKNLSVAERLKKPLKSAKKIVETTTAKIDNAINKVEQIENTANKFENNTKMQNYELTSNVNFKTISKERENEIQQMIKSHEKWLESNGRTGEKLVLNNENLNGFKFYECDLRYAEIKNCDLSNCVFYADLSEATFSNNKISGTKWIGSDINDMKTDQVTKLSISETLKNNKTHDVMADKLKDKKKDKTKNKKKEKEYVK